MKTRPYTVLYSQGPHDNPTDGVLEVEAVNLAAAYAQALILVLESGGDPRDIDGIVLTEVWEETHLSGLTDEQAQALDELRPGPRY